MAATRETMMCKPTGITEDKVLYTVIISPQDYWQ